MANMRPEDMRALLEEHAGGLLPRVKLTDQEKALEKLNQLVAEREAQAEQGPAKG